MCFYADGYCEVYNRAYRKARKEHFCSECGNPIKTGERYQYHSWVFDGSAGSDKECQKCETLRQYVHDKEIEEGCSEAESWAPIGFLKSGINDGGYGLLTWEQDSDPISVKPIAAHLYPDIPVSERT